MLRARGIRCYGTALSPLPPLPAASEWRKTWSINLSRRTELSVSNPQTAKRLVETYFPPDQKTPGGKGKVVIEAFAGPGLLTRALLQLPPNRMRKLIVLESNPKLYELGKELEKHDPRVKALQLGSYDWTSYDQIEEEGLLSDVSVQDWQDESELEFLATIPHTVSGEQFVAQLLRSIPERSWLFKYGRMRMNMIMPDLLYNRIDAPVGKKARCKLSVIAEATSRFRQTMPLTELRPYDDHFWPPSYIPRNSLPDSRRPGHPMVAATFKPLKKQIIQPGKLDKWDYCLRRLFVLKAYELKKALPSLAPGANNMTQYMHGPDVPPEDQVNMRQRIQKMTIKDWENIVKAFDKWPFAPEMLYLQDVLRDDAAV